MVSDNNTYAQYNFLLFLQTRQKSHCTENDITKQSYIAGIWHMKDNGHSYTFSENALFDIRSCFSARICKKIYWERHFRLNITIDRNA